MNIFEKIILSILKLSRRLSSYKKVRRIDTIPEEAVGYNEIIIVSTEGMPKWLIFRCPCGCGEEHTLSLAKMRCPHWDVSINREGKITVSPSINVKKPGCGAHFFIRSNKVVWAEPIPSIFSHW